MNTALSRLGPIDSLLPDLLRHWSPSLSLLNSTTLSADIRVDVTENDKEYLVTADLPGVKKDDIRVSIDGSYVSISAEVKKDKKKENGRSIIQETYRGSMSRGFSLPTEVDDKSASAKLEDGVLRLTLPKRTGGSRSLLQIK